MKNFIDDYRVEFGVEPICRVLPIAPSTYFAHTQRLANPAKASARFQRDEALAQDIQRIYQENFHVYGARKVWRQLQREGKNVARCTVERLMNKLGIKGAIRGKPIKTTISDKKSSCPLDKVKRKFNAPCPNRLWVADFTYGAPRPTMGERMSGMQ